jgi:Probable lipoprotein LpqN
VLTWCIDHRATLADREILPTIVRCAAVVALLALLTACGAKTPDYQSILSTTTTATSSTDKPEPISEYLQSVGVIGEPIRPDKLTDLTVNLPRPPGWQTYDNPNLAPGTEVIAKGDTYPTAMLMVFQLKGDFDVKDALKHADADAELSQNFNRADGSTADFRGFPSSMIQGTYDLNGRRMQSYNRVIIATGTPARPNLPGQKYLIQLTVTDYADQAAAHGPDIDGIIKGFVVKAK